MFDIKNISYDTRQRTIPLFLPVPHSNESAGHCSRISPICKNALRLHHRADQPGKYRNTGRSVRDGNQNGSRGLESSNAEAAGQTTITPKGEICERIGRLRSGC